MCYPCVLWYTILVCNVSFTIHQPAAADDQELTSLSDTKSSILWTGYIIVQVNNVHKYIDIYIHNQSLEYISYIISE